MVPERIARLAHRHDEPCCSAEVVYQVAGMQSLGQLAPVGELGLGDSSPISMSMFGDLIFDCGEALVLIASPASTFWSCGVEGLSAHHGMVRIPVDKAPANH